MPKMKTNRASLKRFKRKGNGQLKRRRANRNHILTKKSKQRKRQLRTMPMVHKNDEKAISALLRDQ